MNIGNIILLVIVGAPVLLVCMGLIVLLIPSPDITGPGGHKKIPVWENRSNGVLLDTSNNWTPIYHKIVCPKGGTGGGRYCLFKKPNGNIVMVDVYLKDMRTARATTLGGKETVLLACRDRFGDKATRYIESVLYPETS